MVDRGLEALEIRLRRVEGRLKFVFVGWFLSVMLLVFLGALVPRVASQPAVLRAHAIELLDERGRVRINLRTLKDDSEISMFDPAGKSGISLVLLGGTTPMLVLHDSAGHARAELHLDTDGSPLLWLFGTPRIALFHSVEGGLPAAVLGLETDGSQLLRFRNSTGRTVFQAPWL